MTPLLMLLLTLLMVATSFLSGLFGMAGGMILMGVLIAVMPLPAAMVLHAITQMASNGWRGLLWWRYVHWRSAGVFLVGAVLALAAWSLWRYVPSKPIALIFLGVTPFLIRLMPSGLTPNPESRIQAVVYGAISMTLMLLAGVSGPLIDIFFLGGKLDRREIIATKAVCQIFSHAMKLAYFGGIVDQAASLDPWLAFFAIAASMIGTSLAKQFLEAMTDKQYRVWANRLITTIAGYFLLHGTYLLLLPQS